MTSDLNGQNIDIYYKQKTEKINATITSLSFDYAKNRLGLITTLLKVVLTTLRKLVLTELLKLVLTTRLKVVITELLKVVLKQY